MGLFIRLLRCEHISSVCVIFYELLPQSVCFILGWSCAFKK